MFTEQGFYMLELYHLRERKTDSKKECYRPLSEKFMALPKGKRKVKRNPFIYPLIIPFSDPEPKEKPFICKAFLLSEW